MIRVPGASAGAGAAALLCESPARPSAPPGRGCLGPQLIGGGACISVVCQLRPTAAGRGMHRAPGKWRPVPLLCSVPASSPPSGGSGRGAGISSMSRVPPELWEPRVSLLQSLLIARHEGVRLWSHLVFLLFTHILCVDPFDRFSPQMNHFIRKELNISSGWGHGAD